MNENKELLVLIHDNTKMGLTSTQKLITLIKDKNNKIKNILENELKEYTAYYKECKRLMKKNKIKIEHTEFLKNLTSTVAMKMEVNKDNSDSKIASILIRGFNMGNIDIEARIKNYKKEVDKDILKLAKDILTFGETETNKLKAYL
jgi:Zn-dependent M32 family carboxypeptidase